MTDQTSLIASRYERRFAGDRYSLLRPDVWLSVQERQRVLLRLFVRDLGWYDLTNLKLTEVGCGNGGNLLDFLRFGFAPQNLCGIELLPERAIVARNMLPTVLAIHECDANSADIVQNSQDVVFQSVVFSSLLDDDFQQALANRMWQWVKPGGGVLWYDFVYNNPANTDVRGVPVSRVRELFPEGKMIVRSVTLAPPISRRLCKFTEMAYHVFNAVPFLRTHRLIWIGKA
jgi:SAM-dependent methyltransferase